MWKQDTIASCSQVLDHNTHVTGNVGEQPYGCCLSIQKKGEQWKAGEEKKKVAIEPSVAHGGLVDELSRWSRHLVGREEK